MYRTVIKLKDNLPEDKLIKIHKIANLCYDNNAGKIENSSKDKYTLIFEGDQDNHYGCTLSGNSRLYKIKGFKELVESWTWVDTDEGDIEDVLEILDEFYKNKRKVS